MIRLGTIRDIHNTLTAISEKERTEAVKNVLVTVGHILSNEGCVPTFFVSLDLDSCLPRKVRSRSEGMPEDIHLSLKSFNLKDVKYFAVIIE